MWHSPLHRIHPNTHGTKSMVPKLVCPELPGDPLKIPKIRPCSKPIKSQTPGINKKHQDALTLQVTPKCRHGWEPVT